MEGYDGLGSLLWRHQNYPNSSLGEGAKAKAYSPTQSGDGAWEKERLIKACQEFEAIFIQEVMKNMRRTVPESSRSREGTLYRDLFDEEVSRALSVRGLGLKELMLRLLDRESFRADGPQVFSDAADKTDRTP